MTIDEIKMAFEESIAEIVMEQRDSGNAIKNEVKNLSDQECIIKNNKSEFHNIIAGHNMFYTCIER